MRKHKLISLAGLALVPVLGCSKPDQVETIKSPTAGMYYTVETFKTAGPTSDFTRVYAHLERDGKAKKMLVLDGENLTVPKIIWNNPHDATLCVGSGITNTFRNEVTLIVGDTPDASETIYNHLGEHCDGVPTTTASTGN